MNLKRLEYFYTLAQTGNMAKASELLYISPPALSKSMKLLEQELEVRLWIRDGRKMILTDAGKNLFKRTPHLIDEIRIIKDSLNEKNNPVKPTRIGTFEVFSTYFLSFLDKLEWKSQPLELQELLPGEVERYVASGEIDLGITYMPIPDPQLDFLKVTSIEMGVFTKADAFKGIAQSDLPFVIPIMPLQGVPTKVRGLDGWPEDAYQRKVLHKVTLLESALELCRQGRVAGYFPAFIVHEHNKKVKEEFRLERRKSPYSNRVCKADVYLVKRKSDEESNTAKQLAKALRLICHP